MKPLLNSWLLLSLLSSDGLRVSLSFKSCLDQQFCQAGSYTASVEEDVHIQTQIACCQEDQCNSGSLQYRKGMINGTQKEDPCFSLAGPIKRSILNGRSAFQGCTTAKACGFKKETVKAANQVFGAQISQADCKPAEKVTPQES